MIWMLLALLPAYSLIFALVYFTIVAMF